jgi:hypothetical protein
MATDAATKAAEIVLSRSSDDKSDQRGVLGKSQSWSTDILPALRLGCSRFQHWPQRRRKLETAWEAGSSSGPTEHHTSSWPMGCEACS